MNYFRFGIIGICIFFIIFAYILNKENTKLHNQVDILVSNQKASALENTSLKETSRVYKYTIEQLTYFNDSLIQKMDSIRGELKIKDKNLIGMQYLASNITKKDTIVFSDTIFKEKEIFLDTIVGNKWYNIKLNLKYPNIVYIEPTFVSKKYIIINKKKETINPPKKFFLFRWFQKKHWVMEVHIKDENPYINETDNKFIEIIK